MNTTISTLSTEQLLVVSFAGYTPPQMSIRCIKVGETVLALDRPSDDANNVAVLLYETDNIEAFSMLLSAIPYNKKQLITTLLTMSEEVSGLCSIEEMMVAAERSYGKDFVKQKKSAFRLLSLSKEKKQILVERGISPSFYYSALEEETDDIVDALTNLADMNTATLRQLTSWMKDILTRDKTELSKIIFELDSLLPSPTENDRKQRGTKLKELIFIKRFPNWSSRHEAAENIKKGIRAQHRIQVEYPPFFEGNSLIIRASISTPEEIKSTVEKIEKAGRSLENLLKIVHGEDV